MVEKENTQHNPQYIIDPEQQSEYYQFVKDGVNSGKYFKDALEWYHFRYITPICERAILMVAVILLFSLIYIAKTMYDSMFPLVVQQPIFTSSKYEFSNKELYTPKIVKLRPRKGEAGYDPNVDNFDESILKYLLINYVRDREQYDFRKARIEDVNKKFNRVKSKSNLREYKNFQLIMSKENPNSPMKLFGKNSRRDIEINSIKFNRREPKNFAEKIVFFIANSIPTQAEIMFTAITTNIDELGNSKQTREQFLSRLTFEYQPVFLNDNQSNITFNVNSYVLYRVKN